MMTTAYENRADGNNLAGRMAACFAAVTVAAKLSHKVISFPWQFEDPILPLWDELTCEAPDRAADALRLVADWARSHPDEFFRPRGDRMQQPPHGWAGHWSEPAPIPDDGEADGRPRTGWIGFVEDRLHKILKDGGYEPTAIVRTWKDRDWLEQTPESTGNQRLKKKAKLAGENVWLFAVRWAAIDAVESET